MKQLTRKQLQNDIAALRKHREMDLREIDGLRREILTMRTTIDTLSDDVAKAQEEAADWRFAFRAICKATAR